MLNVGKDYQDQIKTVLVYEAYMNIDMDGKGEAKRYKITKAGNVILDIEECDDLPLFITAHYQSHIVFMEVVLVSV